LEGGYTKSTKPDRPHVSPKGCSGCPTAWAYISSQASLSAVAGLLQTIGLDAALNGSFTGTLVLPTNDVRAAWFASFFHGVLLMLWHTGKAVTAALSQTALPG
jgi:hypothetical protein